MDVLIFGAGNYGKMLCDYYLNSDGDRVVGLIDTYSNDKNYKGVMISRPEEIPHLCYDRIVISMKKASIIEEAKETLEKLQVPKELVKVFVEDEDYYEQVVAGVNTYDENTNKRVWWLKCFAKYVYDEGISGDVAECGVFRGEFAFYINKYFPDRELYLFDTFEGFDIKDVDRERQLNNPKFLESEFNSVGAFENTNERIVMRRMLYKEKIHLVKGYFPDSANGIMNKYCFVNLDMDLYQPMYEGLKYFCPQMVKGGVILLHDFYKDSLPGVKKAVYDYENNYGRLHKFPVGDNCSIAVVL